MTTKRHRSAPSKALGLIVLGLAIVSPLAISGCYFLAGAAAGAGAYAVSENPPGEDDDE